jgi:hypothetical protein
MQPYVRNDATLSVGPVVSSERLDKTVLSSIRLSVEARIKIGCYKYQASSPEGCVLFNLFYRVYFTSGKAVTRTSKALIA